MKQIFLLPLLVLILTLLAKQKQPEIAVDIYAKRKTAIACFPERSRSLVIDGIGLLPGSGKHHWQVSSNDSAQIYFDQGINMYYSFHIIEALASFVKAQQFDPENAMLHWGEALTYSPNINDVGYIQPEDAMKAVQKANALASQRSTIEKDFITAMHTRFSADPSISREQLNVDYKDAMAALAAKYPTNAEVLALYADAMMILHPWDLYHGDGKPKAWTPALVEVLEKGLSIDTDHPGLNHYYIHAIEGSANPGRAIRSADKLDGIVPGAAHMVHMPSHIYIRTGNYARGITVNEAALRGYKNYLAIYPKVAAGDFLYQVHNTHMMAACAIMNGNMAEAIQVSNDCVAQVPEEYHHMDGPMAEFMQYASATPIFAKIRYGQWDQLLASLKPLQTAACIFESSTHLVAVLPMRARAGSPRRRQKSTSLTYLMENNPKLKEKAFNSAYDGANVAKHMLGGVIAELKKDYEHAAVSCCDRPQNWRKGWCTTSLSDWILPPLPYLGNVLLKGNQFMDAEKVFRKDLAFNPSNLWSLRGLMLAQLYQGRKSEANKTSKALAAAMVYSDFGKLEGAVF
jgi:tetratricopeptide (TPR) repeat protein